MRFIIKLLLHQICSWNLIWVFSIPYASLYKFKNVKIEWCNCQVFCKTKTGISSISKERCRFQIHNHQSPNKWFIVFILHVQFETLSMKCIYNILRSTWKTWYIQREPEIGEQQKIVCFATDFVHKILFSQFVSNRR